MWGTFKVFITPVHLLMSRLYFSVVLGEKQLHSFSFASLSNRERSGMFIMWFYDITEVKVIVGGVGHVVGLKKGSGCKKSRDGHQRRIGRHRRDKVHLPLLDRQIQVQR